MIDPAWLSVTSGELKWLGAVLGDVRDADVLLERLHRQSAELSSRDARATAALLRRLTVQRDAARLALLAAFRGERYVVLLDRLIAASDAVPVADGDDKPARDALPELVRRPWNHLKKEIESLDTDPADEALHQVRIRAKRARCAS